MVWQTPATQPTDGPAPQQSDVAVHFSPIWLQPPGLFVHT
jgi:hypothetical protein